MSKAKERLRALQLRRSGHSIKNIAKSLKVSRSSASTWCRDIKLSKAQSEKLRLNAIAAGNSGRMVGARRNKERRLNEISRWAERGRNEIGVLSKRDLLILSSALFWAEGAKTGSRFMFVNTDPYMIRIMHGFLIEIMEVPVQKLYLTVQVNRVHEVRIDKILRFWSKWLNLPLQQFTKPYYINIVPKKQYENFDEYYGVARLGVRGGASLQYRILGYINALKSI